jgi:hypothetical protein
MHSKKEDIRVIIEYGNKNLKEILLEEIKRKQIRKLEDEVTYGKDK